MGASLEPWAIVFLCLGGLVVVYYVLKSTLQLWAASAYKHIKENPTTSCDIDAFVGQKYPVDAVKVVFAHKLRLGSRIAKKDPIPLEVIPSPHVDGLYVSFKSGDVEGMKKMTESSDKPKAMSIQQLMSESSKPVVVVATIRMGFGHHRLAYSSASWALQQNCTTVFHDLLNISGEESELLKSTDDLYSKFSRYASEMGGPVEKLWGSLMLSGDANALRVAALTAAHLQPILSAWPLDIPLITTHQLVALTASACGFTNVVNLVVDNHPQWFLTVPNTLNIVQGPVNYQSFLKMGVKSNELAWAGHWCPVQMVQHIEEDCNRRMERCQAFQPLRILIPVGGAGAQRKFIVSFCQALAPLVKEGKVQLLLNAGDHVHMKTAFLQVLDQSGLEFDTVEDTAGVRAFQESLLQGAEPSKAVTLFTFADYFPAVATTDILSRCADVLACKPSELAFYCLPKLHIRRVGDHEAFSATRAAELGDGSVEAREIDDAMQFVQLFLSTEKTPSPLLLSMNQSIINNNKIGLYGGCEKAVEWALKKKN